MADRDDSNSPTVLNRFQKFITQIALEVTSFEVKIIKSLIRGILPARVVDDIDIKDKLPALDLFARLQEYCKISENNLELLKEILRSAGRKDLEKKVKRFEEKVTELIDAPVSQMENLELQEQNTVLLRLLLSNPRRSEELTQKTNALRESVCKKLGLELKDVVFTTKEDASIPDCVFIVFQFPNLEPKIKELNCYALDRAVWLVNDGVLQLQIGDKASINIKEDLQDIKPIPRRQTSVLAMNPSFDDHRDNTLDVILGIELSSLANDDVISQLFSKCQSAINVVSQPRGAHGFDTKLGVVTYSNHLNAQQPIAFAPEGLSKDFDVMKYEKQSSSGDGCCGMADVVKKVLELTGARKEASKVCIVFTFLNQKSCDPGYYKCSHGNDIIKLCNEMSKDGITLYIIGINSAQSQLYVENHFLSGVAAIGGGLYLEVDDLDSLHKLITCIIKHDASIERHGKVTCKALIDEINRKFGIVNINHLARYLKQFLNQNAVGIDGFRENGEILTAPLSQISQRVAMADDLEDAISAVRTMSLRFKANATNERGKANLRSCGVRRKKLGFAHGGVIGAPMETGTTEDCSKAKLDVCVDNLAEEDGNGVCMVENEQVDLEVAARVVRRQIHRLEYQKINEEQMVSE